MASTTAAGLAAFDPAIGAGIDAATGLAAPGASSGPFFPDDDEATAKADPSRAGWLDAELDRIWLLGEHAFRALQRAGLRPPADSPTIADLEAVLLARRGSARGELADRLRRATVLAVARRQRSPLGILASKLGLRPLEIDALLFALAPHVDPMIVRLLTAIRGNLPGRGIDPALIGQILGLPRAERVALLDVIDERRPLLAWDLVRALPCDAAEAWQSLQHRTLQPTADALALLAEGAAISPSLSGRATLTTAPAGLDDLVLDDEPRQRWGALLAELEHARRADRLGQLPWLALWGARGAGRRTLAGRIATAAGQPILAITVRGVEDLTMLRAARRDALLHGALLHVDVPTGPLQDDGAAQLLQHLRHHPGLVSLGLEASASPVLRGQHPVRELQVPGGTAIAREALWRRALAEVERDPSVDPHRLATLFRLTPGEILATAEEAVAYARATGARLDHEQLRAGVDRRLRNELCTLAVPVVTTATWDDFVLPEHDLERVWELIHRRRLASVVMEDWGFGRRLSYGRGVISLFSGPPGTGKTMLAGLIARELQLALYQIDLSQVMSRWLGETEKQLASVFELAERAQAVLLFDEADSLFAKRTDVTSSNDRYANLAVNYLLQRLEQYTGVVILTTNKDAALDEALRRRLTLHLQLDIPEAPERERLWRTMFSTLAPLSDDVHFEELAADHELGGGYIKNAAVRAAFLAASVQQPITMEILRKAVALEMEDMGQLATVRRTESKARRPGGHSSL